MWIEYNPNPDKLKVGDCVIRALTVVLGESWEAVYIALSVKGLEMSDMPAANRVWGALLKDRGYEKKVIPDTCPECYTVEDFAKDNPEGVYMLATGTHVVVVVDGNYYDMWDSGREVPIYYYANRKN